MDVDGDYKLNLMIALANVRREGKFKAKIGKKLFLKLSLIKYNYLDNLKIRLRLRTTKYVKDDEEFIKFSDVQTQVKLGMIKISVEDIFQGDKVLSEVGDTIINQNIHNFISEIEPKIQSSLGEKLFFVIFFKF